MITLPSFVFFRHPPRCLILFRCGNSYLAPKANIVQLAEPRIQPSFIPTRLCRQHGPNTTQSHLASRDNTSDGNGASVACSGACTARAGTDCPSARTGPGWVRVRRCWGTDRDQIMGRNLSSPADDEASEPVDHPPAPAAGWQARAPAGPCPGAASHSRPRSNVSVRSSSLAPPLTTRRTPPTRQSDLRVYPPAERVSTAGGAK